MTPAVTADLRSTLHLAVDAAIQADDAITLDNADTLRHAVDILEDHVVTIRSLVGSNETVRV